MQNFRTLGLIIKKVRNLFNLSDKYGKIIRCELTVLELVVCDEADLADSLHLIGQELQQLEV